MSVASIPLRIAQISDLHCGEITFSPKLMQLTIERVNRMEPDLVVVAGDLTGAGYEWEFEEAKGWISQIEAPKIVVPGNHDARNVGYIHFERLFGRRNSKVRIEFDPERQERLLATGVTVVGVDSSLPDVNEGEIGLERYRWIADQFTHPSDIKILTLHHHLVPIPGTGRERNIITDAGDFLAEVVRLDLDIVLSGHKHVPFFWGLNGILICNSSTVSTRRVRGVTPPSWSELRVDAATIKVWLHYEDGRRELSMIRSRKTRAMIREAFFLTDEFLTSNRMVPSARAEYTGVDAG